MSRVPDARRGKPSQEFNMELVRLTNPENRYRVVKRGNRFVDLQNPEGVTLRLKFDGKVVNLPAGG